jgi:hypothetical protein
MGEGMFEAGGACEAEISANLANHIGTFVRRATWTVSVADSSPVPTSSVQASEPIKLGVASATDSSTVRVAALLPPNSDLSAEDEVFLNIAACDCNTERSKQSNKCWVVLRLEVWSLKKWTLNIYEQMRFKHPRRVFTLWCLLPFFHATIGAMRRCYKPVQS